MSLEPQQLQRLLRKRSRPPVAFGAGLVVLDVVIGWAAVPKLTAGGTCANVLVILSYLGWRTYPVARLNGDSSSRFVLSDLRRWHVRTDFAKLDPPADTPVVLERLGRAPNGAITHAFSSFRSHRPLPNESAVHVAQRMRSPAVFFFDRVSVGALLLAKHAAAAGAVVVFEPSLDAPKPLMDRALGLAHVVKYSRDRRAALPKRLMGTNTLLVLETDGARGLRYTSRLTGASAPRGVHVPALLTSVIDAAGAGDWCTAGVLHVLARNGLGGLRSATQSKLDLALAFGQLLGAWACRYEGARGAMYEGTTRDLRRFMTQASGTKATTANTNDRPAR